VRARHKQHLCLVWAQTRETQQQEWCAARTPVRRLSRSSASWLTSCCVRQGGTAAAVTSSSPCTCCAPSTTLCSGYNLLASTSAKTQRGEERRTRGVPYSLLGGLGMMSCQLFCAVAVLDQPKRAPVCTYTPSIHLTRFF